MPTVLIATPILRGQLEPEYLHSLMATRRHLYQRQIGHNIISNECSLISAGRNEMCQAWVNQTNADYLMFIDSDMQFPPYGVGRLVRRDVDVIGGVYFRKEAEARPLVFDYNADGMFETIQDVPADHVFECDGIGTGFMLIKRKVIESFTAEVTKTIGNPFGIGFGPTGREEGEDLSFCRRVQKLGFKVWADPTIPLGHLGKIAYTRQNYEGFKGFQEWRRERLTYSNDIEGWMSPGELNYLYHTAKDMDSIIEVGSWKGRSTHALLSGCRGKVIAIDTWKGTQGEAGNPHVEAVEHDIFNDCFMKNVGHFENLEAWPMTSLEAAARVPDKSVDMVFIDGDHSYEAVKADIAAWTPKARKLLCGHDWQWHTVQEAVTERFGEPDLNETIWIKRLEA
jgi:hypothetical protein